MKRDASSYPPFGRLHASSDSIYLLSFNFTNINNVLPESVILKLVYKLFQTAFATSKIYLLSKYPKYSNNLVHGAYLIKSNRTTHLIKASGKSCTSRYYDRLFWLHQMRALFGKEQCIVLYCNLEVVLLYRDSFLFFVALIN